MKVSRIHLSNFRTHADTEVVLPDEGVIGFIGPNGCGKSTIGIEALGFALYGTKATRGTKSSLRWNRAPARHVAAVELEFSVGGRDYRVERSETDAKLFEIGQAEPIAAGTSAVDGFTPGLIGMSWEEFSSTYLCEQKQLQKLANMGGTERRQFFLRVLGVGQIDQALSDCRQRKNDLSREVDGIRAGLGDRSELLVELDEARTAERTAASRREETNSKAAAATREREEAQAAFSGLEELRTQWTSADRTFATAQARVEGAAAELASAEHALEGAEPFFDTTPQDQRDVTVARGRDIAAQLAELQRERTDRRADADAEARAAATEVQRIDQRIQKFDRLGADSPCPSCERPLGSHYQTVRDGLVREREAAEERRRAAQERAAASSAPSEEETALQARIEALRAVVEGYRAEDQAVARFDTARQERDRRSAALEAARNAVQAAAEARDGLSFDQETYQERRAALSRAVEAEGTAGAAAAAALEAYRAAGSRLDRATRQLEQFDQRAKKLEVVEADLKTHARASERLSEFRTEMASSIRPELEALASGFVQILTDGRHEGLVLDDDFNARLLEGGLETEVVSGGTEDVTAIAMRLAISQMIAERAGHPLSLLILDEPFGSLDAVRRSNVLELIRRLGTVFAQVILISHVDETREAVDHAIELTYDEHTGRTEVMTAGAAAQAA